MPVQTKATLQSNSSATYVDNVTGSITPTIVRTFTSDMIDSWLNQIVPGGGTPAGSLVQWTGSSTTAQLILGASNTILYAETSTTAWTPAGTITVKPTSVAPNLIIAGSTDNLGIQLAGTSHTVQLNENLNGGELKIVSAS